MTVRIATKVKGVPLGRPFLVFALGALLTSCGGNAPGADSTGDPVTDMAIATAPPECRQVLRLLAARDDSPAFSSIHGAPLGEGAHAATIRLERAACTVSSDGIYACRIMETGEAPLGVHRRLAARAASCLPDRYAGGAFVQPSDEGTFSTWTTGERGASPVLEISTPPPGEVTTITVRGASAPR